MPTAAKTFGGSSDERRGNAASRGYDAAHRRRRDLCLSRANYTCECPGCPNCSPAFERPCAASATVADHIKPHRGNRQLLEDMGNLAAKCKVCHDFKTLVKGE